MRVTKLIREYVEKTVKGLPKFTEPTQEEKDYEALQEKIKNFAESVEAELKQSMQEAIDNFRTVHNIGNDVSLHPYECSIIRYSTYNCALARKAEGAKQRRIKARNEAIENILVNLELGATKAELDDMLKALAE